MLFTVWMLHDVQCAEQAAAIAHAWVAILAVAWKCLELEIGTTTIIEETRCWHYNVLK